MAQSTFLCGHNKYAWQADMFWLIKDADTPHRILEGKYDKREHGKVLTNAVAMNPLDHYDPVRGACYTHVDFGNDNHLVDELAEVISS